MHHGRYAFQGKCSLEVCLARMCHIRGIETHQSWDGQQAIGVFFVGVEILTWSLFLLREEMCIALEKA